MQSDQLPSKRSDRRALERDLRSSTADAVPIEGGALPARRRFLQASAALLSGAALPKSAHAFTDPTTQLEHGSYSIGLVAQDDMALQVYLATGPDGRGFVTLGDVLHPAMNSYLEIQRSGHQGNAVRYEGRVSASNTPALVGLNLTVEGRVENELTDLRLLLGERRFHRQGPPSRIQEPHQHLLIGPRSSEKRTKGSIDE